jgi:hypothetical protein
VQKLEQTESRAAAEALPAPGLAAFSAPFAQLAAMLWQKTDNRVRPE